MANYEDMANVPRDNCGNPIQPQKTFQLTCPQDRFISFPKTTNFKTVNSIHMCPANTTDIQKNVAELEGVKKIQIQISKEAEVFEKKNQDEITLVPLGQNPHSYHINTDSGHAMHFEDKSDPVPGIDVELGINVADYADEPNSKSSETPEEKEIREMKDQFVNKRTLKSTPVEKLVKDGQYLIEKDLVKPVPLRKNHKRQTKADGENFSFHCFLCPHMDHIYSNDPSYQVPVYRYFTTNEMLVRHYKQHLGINDIRCPVHNCSERFYRSDHLDRHMKNVHSQTRKKRKNVAKTEPTPYKRRDINP